MATAIYEVKTQQFSGPFDKLLELIEEKKLDITALSLSEVTADFLSYVETLKQGMEQADENHTISEEHRARTAIHMRVVADFLVIAARLVLIKSKTLLPELSLTTEEKEVIGDLETRLRLYRAYKEASKHIEKLIKKRVYFFNRGYLQGIAGGFYPADNLNSDRVWGAATGVFAMLQEFVMEQRSISHQVIKIEEKIAHIVSSLKERLSMVFKDVVHHASRTEIVVSFLALLHLLKHREVETEQEAVFGDIHIKKVEKRG